MPREKVDTEIRQEQILQAALDVVSQKGMAGLSIGAVARRVGVVPSALYRHFKNKDSIIEGVLALIESRLLENINAVKQEAPAPLSALEALLRRHVRLIRENAGIPRVVFSEEVYGSGTSRRAQVQQLLQRYLDGIAAFFALAQQDGVIRQDLNPAELSVMFLGLIQPAAILWHVSDGGFDVTHQTEKAWRVFREAILLQ